MGKLTDLTTEYLTIAVAGMCKNAGKTTVVNHLLRQYNVIYKTGLTSIGYDGEDVDEITMLEKPRIGVYPGMIVATCEGCLNSATAEFKILCSAGIRTVLGEILIIEITSPGIAEVSGPSTVKQMCALCNKLQELGCRKIIIDGAAGRLSFTSETECTILAVGAALSSNMTKVVKAARHQAELLNLCSCTEENVTVLSENAPYATEKHDGRIFCIFRGPAVDRDINEIIRHNKGCYKTLVVKDAASAFISPAVYRKLIHRKGTLCVINKTNLVAITINPMTPYGKWFDKDRFLQEMLDHMDMPVVNVMDEKK